MSTSFYYEEVLAFLWQMKIIIAALLFICSINDAFSQLTGRAKDTVGNPIPFVSIRLINARDSMLIGFSLADSNGHFSLVATRPGTYQLKLSAIGYEDWLSPVFILSVEQMNRDFSEIVMHDSGGLLGNVVVKGFKSLVEQQAAGITVNVQNSLLSKGSTVLEVLTRSPGVALNPTGTDITLNGKSGVLVMLDGRLLRMPMAQLMALLNSMSADNIDQIELLNTPPAKYDADGNAGLINIITKKAKQRGTRGSVTASAGYGRGEKLSAGFFISHNTGTVNVQGSYSYGHSRGYGALYAGGTENVGVIGGQASFNYTSIQKPISNYNSVNLTTDIHIKTGITIGAGINMDLSNSMNNSVNHGYYALQPDSVLIFNSMLTGNNHSNNMIGDIYFEKIFSKKEKLLIEGDYIYYKSDGPTNVQSTFINNDGNAVGANDSLYANQQRDLSNTLIQVWVEKADYNGEINKKLKFESGVKGTYTKSAALSGIENFVNGDWVPSSVGTTSSLGTREEIAAAYATLQWQIDSFSTINVGARYEYSHNGTDKPVDSLYNVNRSLGKLFPAIIFSRVLNDRSSLQLSYTNRVTRPSYNDLASYIIYNDPVSVFTGNPTLQPTITHNFKIGYNVSHYLFSLLYSRDENPILQTSITTGPTQGLVYLKPENANWQNTFNIQAIIPVTISKWWTMSYTITGGPKQYKVSFTPQPFEKTFFSWSANFAESFTLANEWSAELSGYYNSPSYYGNSRNGESLIFNAGIKKQLKNDHGSFQLSISDLLRGASYHSAVGAVTKDAFNSDVWVNYQGESRSFPIVKLSFYRSFGKGRKLKGKKAIQPKKNKDVLIISCNANKNVRSFFILFSVYVHIHKCLIISQAAIKSIDSIPFLEILKNTIKKINFSLRCRDY